VTVRPPRLAERLVTWSLDVADREAVLGDLHEEFAAMADESGAAAATRWYLAQTARSVVPNALRRIRAEYQRRLANESDSDREMRKSVRAFALWLIVVPGSLVLALVIGAWFQDLDLSVTILGAPFAVIGVLMLLTSALPKHERRLWKTRRQLRRLRIFNSFWLVSAFGLGLGQHAGPLRFVNRIALLLGTAILCWPSRYWPIRPRGEPPDVPQILSPFVGGYGHDGPTFLPVDAPEEDAGLGDLIIARGRDSRIVIDRAFSRADNLRVYATTRQGDAPVQATLEVIDHTFHVIAEMAVPVEPVSFVGSLPDAAAPASVVKQIDVTVALEDLDPGSYYVRLITTDGPHTSLRDASFRVIG